MLLVEKHICRITIYFGKWRRKFGKKLTLVSVKVISSMPIPDLENISSCILKNLLALHQRDIFLIKVLIESISHANSFLFCHCVLFKRRLFMSVSSLSMGGGVISSTCLWRSFFTVSISSLSLITWWCGQNMGFNDQN